MRIAIDIDDTLCKTGKVMQRVAEEFAKQRGIAKPIDDTEDYDMVRRWGFDGDDVSGYKEKVKREVDISRLKPVDKLHRLTQWAKRKRHSIVIITQRNTEWFCGDEDKLHRKTSRWLRMHGVDAVEVIYADSVKDKVEKAKEARCRIIIDDDYEVCKVAKNRGIEGIWYVGEFGKISDEDMRKQATEYPIKMLTSWRNISTLD